MYGQFCMVDLSSNGIMIRLVNRFVEASSSYDLKITQPGMYIIRAKVENQIINKKFILN